MLEVSNFWKNRDRYSLEQAAYLSIGLEPKEDSQEMPYKVKIAFEDIKANIMEQMPHVKDDIIKGYVTINCGKNNKFL